MKPQQPALLEEARSLSAIFQPREHGAVSFQSIVQPASTPRSVFGSMEALCEKASVEPGVHSRSEGLVVGKQLKLLTLARPAIECFNSQPTSV